VTKKNESVREALERLNIGDGITIFVYEGWLKNVLK
jgi:hypothetical protein